MKRTNVLMNGQTTLSLELLLQLKIDNIQKLIRTPDRKVLSLKRKEKFQKGRIQVSDFFQLRTFNEIFKFYSFESFLFAFYNFLLGIFY